MRGNVSKKCLDFAPIMVQRSGLLSTLFYNGLLYTTKIYVDAATGGALMNKTYTAAYALIENIAQNHYQWTSERVITASSPSKKEAGMHEISSLGHLATKVDALTQKFDKINTSVVTPAPVSPPCKVCGVFASY